MIKRIKNNINTNFGQINNSGLHTHVHSIMRGFGAFCFSFRCF